jgi:hypothetical protein
MAKHYRPPKYNVLLNPLLQALKDLGGSGTIEEIPATPLPVDRTKCLQSGILDANIINGILF